MTSGPLRLEGTLRTSPEIAARFKRSTVREGEIVCALRGPAGLLKIVPPELDGANLTQGTARLSLTDDGLTGYILRAFESPFVKRQVSLQAKGSTFAELTLAVLRGIQIPILKPAVRAAFTKRLDELDAACSASSTSVADCQRLLRELTDQFS
jgi:type I restriction enzyme S subunit